MFGISRKLIWKDSCAPGRARGECTQPLHEVKHDQACAQMSSGCQPPEDRRTVSTMVRSLGSGMSQTWETLQSIVACTIPVSQVGTPVGQLSIKGPHKTLWLQHAADAREIHAVPRRPFDLPKQLTATWVNPESCRCMLKQPQLTRHTLFPQCEIAS